MKPSLFLGLLLTSLFLPHSEAVGKMYKWIKGSVTFYGPSNGIGPNMGGACGYGNTYNKGYGLNTAAASEKLWFRGAGCGGCYQVKCYNSRFCLPGKRVVVTVTNNCPNNWNLPSNAGGWCNNPRRHLDMAIPAFTQIAEYRAGYVPAKMRRVPCIRQGNIKFSIVGNPWFITILVWNVAGDGDVRSVAARADGQRWQALFRNWGTQWTLAGGGYIGKVIHFRIRSGFTNQKIVIANGLPSWWSFGGDYESNRNFKVPRNTQQLIDS